MPGAAGRSGRAAPRTASRPGRRRRRRGRGRRPSPHPLLDHPGQQHLDRAHEEQVGERGADEGRPQPCVAAHEAPPFAQVGDAERDAPPRGRRIAPAGAGARAAGAPAGDQEGRAVQHEHAAGAGHADEHAAQRRPGQPQGQRAHQLVQRVGLRQPLAAEDLGHQRVEGRRVERGARPVQRRQGRQHARARSDRRSSAPPSARAPPPAAGRRRSAASAARSDRWPRRRSAGT